jgi:hypothetical protein
VEWLRVWAEDAKLRDEAPLLYARVLDIRSLAALASGRREDAVRYGRESLALREGRLAPDSAVLAAARAAVRSMPGTG